MKTFIKSLSALIFASAASSYTVQEINDLKAFSEFIKNNDTVIVDVYASWCPPCKRIAPIFAKLSEKNAYHDIKFVKVNIDHAREIAATYSVTSMPTFLYFSEGSLVHKHTGASEKQLTDNIKLYLQ